MVEKKKEVKASKKEKEEIVPYKCYACGRYDGTMGVASGEHTHTCETCKQLPKESTRIERHRLEYEQSYDATAESLFMCPRCELERDECDCPDNPHKRAQIDEILGTKAQ